MEYFVGENYFQPIIFCSSLYIFFITRSLEII